METESSLTPQEVATLLKITKNTVYELIKRGELQSYKVGRKIRVEMRAVEALKDGRNRAEGSPAPSSEPKSEPPSPEGLIICGQDSILDIISRYAEGDSHGIRAYRSHKGSYNGLYALYNGEAQIATAHLWDRHSDSYNIPYLPWIIPGMPVKLIHIAKRMQGFYVKKGNPKKIQSWQDLYRRDVSFVNREKGSGTRVLLDQHICLDGSSAASIIGYGNEVNSHMAAASAICRGRADTALGNEKTAWQVKDIDFIPLQQERYEMVVLEKDWNENGIQMIFHILNSPAFREEIDGLGGYDTSEMGRVII